MQAWENQLGKASRQPPGLQLLYLLRIWERFSCFLWTESQAAKANSQKLLQSMHGAFQTLPSAMPLEYVADSQRRIPKRVSQYLWLHVILFWGKVS